MKKISLGIYITFFLFITACAGNLNSIVVEQLAKSSKSWDGESLPEYPRGQPEITILRIKIPPGAELKMHEHPVINSGYLVSGELTVIAKDNKKLHLKAGD